jgi:hypothetical protein
MITSSLFITFLFVLAAATIFVGSRACGQVVAIAVTRTNPTAPISLRKHTFELFRHLVTLAIMGDSGHGPSGLSRNAGGCWSREPVYSRLRPGG